MKRAIPILAIASCLLCIGFALASAKPAPAKAKIPRIGIDEQATWKQIEKHFEKFLAEGSMEFYVGDLYYKYECAHCLGIGNQGSDPIEFDPQNLKPFEVWCKRNKGKYPILHIGDRVTYPELKRLFKMLNDRGFTFYMNRDVGDHAEIKVDLLDGRPKPIQIPKT